MIEAVLFDLGNTLVEYWPRPEYPKILQQAIAEVQEYLAREGLLYVSPEVIARRVQDENHESEDYRVRPLQERLARIFAGEGKLLPDAVQAQMCRCFMKPMFAWGRLYKDALPVLEELRARGFRTAIISNTPWGSPAHLWREEVQRLGLSKWVDTVVFCSDVGWRKPAKAIFEYTMEQLQVTPGQCLFVGDEPRWDLVGPRAIGIEAVLIDRWGTASGIEEQPIHSLRELLSRLGFPGTD